MKFIFRWAFRLFLLLVVLLVAGILLLDTIIKAVLESRLREQTGMDVKIGSVHLGLISPVFTVENLKLYNTAEFGGSPFLDLPEFHIEYDRGALISHRFHCRLMRINIAEMNFVRSKGGKSNLRVLGERQESARRNARTAGSAEGSAYKFDGIETLNVSLGKARLLNMDAPSQPWDFSLNVQNRVVTGIRTDKELNDSCCLILLEAGAKPLLEFVSEKRAAPREPAPAASAAAPAPNIPSQSAGKQLK